MNLELTSNYIINNHFKAKSYRNITNNQLQYVK